MVFMGPNLLSRLLTNYEIAHSSSKTKTTAFVLLGRAAAELVLLLFVIMHDLLGQL